MNPRHAVGLWAFALLVSASLASAGQPPRVTTTQRAVITPQAFAADDPVMKDPKAAKTLSPTMVSATFTNLPALKAFEELSKQTGYKIELYEPRGQARFANVTAMINNQPFWAAIREICTRGNVNLYYYGDEGTDRIPIMPSNYGQAGMMKAAASIKGPFMTVVSNIERSNTVNMGNPDKVDRGVSFQIYTFAEPKAIPTQYEYEPTIDEAVDENGNSMMPTGNDNNRNLQSSRGVAWHGHFRLPYPTTNPGKRIAKIRGHIDAMIQLGSEAFEIADPLKASEQTKTVGGRKMTFKSMKKEENGRYQVELVMFRGADQDQQNFQQTTYNAQPSMELTDSDKGRYQLWSSGGHGDSEQITRQFTFSRRGGGDATGATAPEPTKLTIQIPTATQEVAIPFELVDLPMP